MHDQLNTTTNSPVEDGYDFFIDDQWGKKYHFRILSFPVSPGLFSEAVEVIQETSQHAPRVYSILSPPNVDIEKAELQLKAKIQKSINQSHLDFEDGEPVINDNRILRGRIDWDDKLDSNFDTNFVIDGKKITIEQFIEMLQVYGGWNFKFEIRDRTDDID